MDHRVLRRVRAVVVMLATVLGALRLAVAAPQDPASSAAQATSTLATPEPARSTEESVKNAVQDATASGVGAKVAEEPGYDLAGYLSLSYRGRHASDGDDDDGDVYGYASIEGGHAEVDDLTFRFFGRGTWDTDDIDGDDTFFSLNDLGNDRVDFHLYEAYVDLRRSLAPESLGLERIRLGRQNIVLDYSYLLDGIRLDFARIASFGDLGISVYGGIPEFLYESSRRTDWIAGIDLNVHPFASTRVDLRYAHIQDSASWTAGQERDDYAALTVRQALWSGAHVVAEWTTIDAATRDASARFAWNIDAADLTITAAYRFQNDVEHEFTTELDPYFGVLGPSFAHHQIDVQVSKLFGEHFGVDVGFTARQLDDDDSDGPFNREYTRGFLTLGTFKWPWSAVDFALTGEVWDGLDDDAWSLGFEMKLRATEALTFTVGSDYSLYKYDLFIVDERQDATTIYLKARWKISKDFRVDGRYEFETGDEGEFHAVLVGLTWSF